MYDYIDRPVSGLKDGNRFLIWAMRHWVQAMMDRKCPSCVIGPAFVKWRIGEGLPFFQAMMTILNLYALQDVSFAPPRCNRISDDEAMLLTILGGINHRAPDAIANTLALIVKQDRVAPLQDTMQRLSHTMGQAGVLPGNVQ